MAKGREVGEGASPKPCNMETKKVLSDKGLFSILTDTEKSGDTDLRLCLVQMLIRIRRLEQVNFAIQALMLNEGWVSPEHLDRVIKNAGEYIDEREEQNSAFCDMLEESGITFEDWINFNLNGSFGKR